MLAHPMPAHEQKPHQAIAVLLIGVELLMAAKQREPAQLCVGDEALERADRCEAAEPVRSDVAAQREGKSRRELVLEILRWQPDVIDRQAICDRRFPDQ